MGESILLTTSFIADISRGKTGEKIFVDDFLEFLQIKYQDVTGSHAYQVIDSDYLSKIGKYEIKCNYKDDNNLIVEDCSVYPNFDGWFYKSKADMLVFISKITRTMILVPFTDLFKQHYENIKDKYSLVLNRVSVYNDKSWQSAYRRIPLESITGFYSVYKRVTQ